LIDEDRQDCRVLKQQLETAALMAGLTTKTSAASDGACHALNRIAIEELYAWVRGDFEAMRQAYPRLPATLSNRPLPGCGCYCRRHGRSNGTGAAASRLLQKRAGQNAGRPRYCPVYATGTKQSKKLLGISRGADFGFVKSNSGEKMCEANLKQAKEHFLIS
jgi:hypothetical protein